VEEAEKEIQGLNQMAIGNRHVDVEKALREAQDATRVGVLVKEIEWISAAAAVELIKPHFKNSAYAAHMRICEHAYARLVRARARRYIIGEAARDDSVVPHIFWWAKGNAALTQDWTTGSFSTYINDIEHRAFGVTFANTDLEKMIPADLTKPPTAPDTPAAVPSAGGRPPADWWEDLLIDLCFKHFHGDLPHQKQADIVRAMQDWITAHGYDASDSTIKLRARKLADAIKRDDAAEN
jgi:hypothetical protein